MSSFLGRYEYQMDEKGRVSLPAAFRRGTEGDRFVLLQWERPYLTLFPEESWAGVQERLLEHRRGRAGAGAYFRQITSTAAEVVPDRQGRILIPARLREMGELDGEVVLVGAIDRVELWNPDRWAQAVPEDGTATPEELASRIFA